MLKKSVSYTIWPAVPAEVSGGGVQAARENKDRTLVNRGAPNFPRGGFPLFIFISRSLFSSALYFISALYFYFGVPSTPSGGQLTEPRLDSDSPQSLLGGQIADQKWSETHTKLIEC